MGSVQPSQKMVIVGAGGFGREVLDVIDAINVDSPQFDFLGFVDEGSPDVGLLDRRGVRLLPRLSEVARRGAAAVIAIADAEVRRRLADELAALGIEAAKLVHPSATIGSLVDSGPGLIVCAHASVTTNVRIGEHVHLDRKSTIGHDCILGDFVTLRPGACVSGNVRLGPGVTIGTGAVLIQGVTVGGGTMVGAGSVVTRDLPAQVVAFGAPARVMRPR